MLSIDTATFIVQQITFLLAYIISVTITGATTAWITNKMGDSTGRDFGYMTLNPFVHINLLGMIMIVWTKIGFGNRVPIHAYNIRMPYRTVKIALAYFADALASLLLAFVSLVALLILFGPSVVSLIKSLLLCAGGISHMQIAQLCPTFSSARITAIFILLALSYLNVVLSVVSSIVNSFYLFIEMRPHTLNVAPGSYYKTFIIPFILILLFSSQLMAMVVDLLAFVAQLLTQFMF